MFFAAGIVNFILFSTVFNFGLIDYGFKDIFIWSSPFYHSSEENGGLNSLPMTSSSFLIFNQSQRDTLNFPDKTSRDTSLRRVVDSLSKVGYDLRKSLPEGYVKDGSIDYTLVIQRVIAKHEVVVFPSFPLLISEKGLRIPSNRKIVFLKGSKLIMKPNNQKLYFIILLNKVSNVTLFNPVIQGDRYKHLSRNGEWGMGIGIYSSSNINIYNANVSNCWGDGIYISQKKDSSPPKNILIQNARCNYNRRNGITIISGINIKLVDPRVSFSNGTPPGAGIDIEPNDPQNEVRDLVIFNPITKYNSGNGIQIGLNRLMKDGLKNVSIQVYNHIDIGSGRGLIVACWPGNFRPNSIKKLNDKYGYIKIINPHWRNNKMEPMKVHSYRADQILLQITNPIINNSADTIKSASYLKNKLQKVLRRGGNIKISGY